MKLLIFQGAGRPGVQVESIGAAAAAAAGPALSGPRAPLTTSCGLDGAAVISLEFPAICTQTKFLTDPHLLVKVRVCQEERTERHR